MRLGPNTLPRVFRSAESVSPSPRLLYLGYPAAPWLDRVRLSAGRPRPVPRRYVLYVGSTAGGREIYSLQTSSLSATVVNLSLDGRPIYVTLYGNGGGSTTVQDSATRLPSPTRLDATCSHRLAG